MNKSYTSSRFKRLHGLWWNIFACTINLCYSEKGSDALGSVLVGEIREQVSNYQTHKQDCSS
jgi:hypothetical protein